MKVLITLCVYLLLGGCSLIEIKEQADMLDKRSYISGRVHVDVERNNNSVYVQLYQQQENVYELIQSQLVKADNSYKLTVRPGNYFVGTFVDNNKDGKFQRLEDASYLGVESISPKSFLVLEGENVILPNLIIKGPIENKIRVQRRSNLSKSFENIGKVISLNNSMLSQENSSRGFWRPFDYLEQFGGGLLMLQAYEEEKTPIIFIHGIFGSAIHFEDIIHSLDRNKYQPWVLQYPSGLPLDLVSDYLITALQELNVRHDFQEVVLVAHSMGGLMTRSFVMKHQAQNPSYELDMVATINSPMYGMDSASKGVEMSPIVIPAWRDVATNSDYVTRVHDWRWPDDVPYYLFFSYLPGEPGDGVVPLTSQLSQSLQAEATKTHGFQAQHAQILSDKLFITELNQILNQ